ncbi:MAG: hypothetical protein AAF843_10465 [Bacteroidota bacterium]
MKKLVIGVLCIVVGSVSAQDVFEKQLFSTDLILKYQEDIGLAEDRVTQIKKIYNDHITTFNIVRWDLDAHMSKMNKLLAADQIDEKESNALMDLILEKEEQLKKMRFKMMVSLKNLLNSEQQDQLHKLKAAHGDPSSVFITQLNENPRVSLKVQGEDGSIKPLVIIKDKKGRQVEGDLESLKPNKIESITVLKGESAKAIYGPKAENGVVTIVLK